MLTRRTVILVGREASYGSTPVMQGSNAILAWDVDMDYKGEVLERDVLRDTLTKPPHAIGMKEVSLTFKTELKGVGTTTCADIGYLLAGCGFNTGTISGTATTYALKSAEADMGSLSFKVYKDGNLHTIAGCRGNAKIDLEAGKYGVVEFEYNGLYSGVAVDTLMDITGLSANIPPICYAAGFQIAGFSPVCSKASLDLGNKVVRRDDLNATYGVREFRITERKGKMEFDADAVVESSNPFWGDWAGEVVDSFGFGIGSSVGNKIIISGYFQYETNKYGDADGVSKYDCVSALCSSDVNTSDDELSIKFA